MYKKKHYPLFRGSPHLKDWQKCYEEWLVACLERSGSEATVAAYRCEMSHFFADCRRAPEHYSRDEVAAFIRKEVRVRGQITKPPSPCTQNRRLATIRSFYDFAGGYNVVYHGKWQPILRIPNPCSSLRAINPGRKPKGLSEDELKRLFAAIPRDSIKGKRDFALFSAYFWSCRRRCEVLRLVWGNLYEVVFMKNEGPCTGRMYRYSSKGHSRDIFTAEYHQEAWNALIDYLKASGRWENMQSDSPLFVSTYYHPGPEKPLHWSAVNIILQEYAKLAGLHTNGRKITVHWLRHTRAQLQRKYDSSPDALETIRKLLGHATLATTWIYLAGGEEKPDSGAAILANRIGSL